VLQTEERITLDNAILVAGEFVWVIITALAATGSGDVIKGATGGYVLASVVVFYARLIAADRHTRLPADFWKYGELRVAGQVLKLGLMITLAQLANFLYAPTDYVMINWLIDPLAVATYAPAVQIDGGLLLLVSGLAAVLLPKSALAHAAGDLPTLRRYYVRGTLASTALLVAGALAVWGASPWIFRIWLDSDMPQTRAILPLVLLHTVIGGSGSVGRSILIGAGRIKPLTAAVLIAALGNVIVSFCAVRFLGWGPYGIIAGTICAAVGCFAIWMPWYVMRTLRRMRDAPPLPIDLPPPPATM
jgi:O-antigen/teichoic acid export membrane protein